MKTTLLACGGIMFEDGPHKGVWSKKAWDLVSKEWEGMELYEFEENGRKDFFLARTPELAAQFKPNAVKKCNS